MKPPKKTHSKAIVKPRAKTSAPTATPSRSHGQGSNAAPMERVVWAVDPFAADLGIEARTGAVLHALGSKLTRVQPVYLVPAPEDAVLGSQPVDARSPWGQRTLERIGQVVAKAKVKAEAPKLLTQPGNSMQLAAAELVTFARAENAQLIAVGTHSRKGPARWFLGSFAETLLLTSPLPVLVANPRSTERRAVKRILFPTDFTDNSREAFAWVKSLAKQLGVELHLFHRNLMDRDPARIPFEPPAVPEALWLRLQEGRLSTGRQWLEEARASGIKAQLHVSRSRASVAEAVSASAKRLAPCMIVLASHGNVVASKLLGSVARQVVRDAPCPVLVIPPRRGT